MKRNRRKAIKRARHGKLRLPPHEALLKALSHPVRRQALEILSKSVSSPTEIADQLNLELSSVSYHVGVLDELGLVEVVEEEAVRGSMAHFYKAVDRPLIDNPNWNNLDPKVRNAVSSYLADTLISDVATSLEAAR